MEFEIKKTIKFNDEDLVDILSSALSGGVGYWAFVEYNPEGYRLAKNLLVENGVEEDSICYEDVLLQMLKIDFPIYFDDIEEYDENNRYNGNKLTLKKLESGIKQSIIENFWDGDWCKFDACVADNIIQLALFGEVVYA